MFSFFTAQRSWLWSPILALSSILLGLFTDRLSSRALTPLVTSLHFVGYNVIQKLIFLRMYLTVRVMYFSTADSILFDLFTAQLCSRTNDVL